MNQEIEFEQNNENKTTDRLHLYWEQIKKKDGEKSDAKNV